MNRLIGLFIAMSMVAIPVTSAAQSSTDEPTSVVAQSNADTQQSPQVEPPKLEKKDNPPPKAHTGWATLLKDTGVDFVAFPRRESTWVILGIGGAAALAAHQGDDYVERHIVGNDTAKKVFAVGKIAGSAEVQIGAAVGLWAVGRYIVGPASDESQTNKFSTVGFDLIRAQIVSQVLVQGIKYSVQRDRPTGECCAFPSGHAASAFAAASVLERHLGYRASWPALVGATYVGASRLVDNRHFLSDVTFGAAVGMASGWTVVGTKGRSGFTMQPVPVKGGMMIALMRVDGSEPKR